MFATLAFSAFQFAGALLDLQVGLGSSHVMNPVNGVPSTLIAQYKSTLAVVLFVLMSGHHMLIGAFVSSYRLMPSFTLNSLSAMQTGVVGLVSHTALLGLQIAAPVLAVSMVVDAALGLVNKAVPQMPVMLVGLPAKLGLGLVALSVGLPALVVSVNSGADLAGKALTQVFRAG
jgi:flagellar biosynthetic protein FliR